MDVSAASSAGMISSPASACSLARASSISTSPVAMRWRGSFALRPVILATRIKSSMTATRAVDSALLMPLSCSYETTVQEIISVTCEISVSLRMSTTLRTYIGRLAAAHGSQSALSLATGIVAPTVSHHLKGSRSITAEHLAAYLAAAPTDLRAGLLTAWLRQALPGDVLDEMAAQEQETPHRVAETGALYRTALRRPDDLDAPTASALAWLSRECAADHDLAELVRHLARRWGWHQDP